MKCSSLGILRVVKLEPAEF